MPKNKEDIVNGKKYHESVSKGDVVVSTVQGLFKGRKGKVVGEFKNGYITKVLVELDIGHAFWTPKNNLMYWEDYINPLQILSKWK